MNGAAARERFLDRAAALNERFHCFVTLTPDEVSTGVGPLAGVPVAVKDCIPVRGVACTWGSALFRDRIAERDAPVVAQLRDAGVRIVGTANLHELAFGGTTQNPWYGNCRNAWNPERVPGGSSGGSAVAVALGLATLGVGTDTGCSVRLPASLNGLLGLRPTHGAISNRDIMPVSPPHDTVGFIAADPETIRLAFTATCRHDPADPFSRSASTFARPGRIRLGIASALLEETEPDIRDSFERAVEKLEGQGCSVQPVAEPALLEAALHIAPLAMADMAEFHRQRLAHDAARIGSAIHQRAARGLAMPATEYAGHLRWREANGVVINRLFETVDAILSPTVPVTAPTLAEAADAVGSTALLSRNCWAAPAAGIPALTVPCGRDRHGIPIGLQLMGRAWSEHFLLDLAGLFLGPAGRARLPDQP
jgi:aspartyl-tRNA(Asn)/glutamyl-tRNA(Gln) amidotransferase subunit A